MTSDYNFYNMQACPNCKRLTLPLIWHGIVPPSCTACGYQVPSSSDDYTPYDSNDFYTDFNLWDEWSNQSQKKRILDKFEKILDKILEE